MDIFRELDFIVDNLAQAWLLQFFKTVVIATRPLAQTLFTVRWIMTETVEGEAQTSTPPFQREMTITIYVV